MALITTKFLSSIIQHFNNVSKRNISLFKRSKKKEFPYLIVRAASDEYCVINELMWQHYYPEEPTFVALGIGHSYNPVLDEHMLNYLTEGLTLVAKCKYNGDIVGVCVNRTVCPWDPDMTDQLACTLSCPLTRQLFHFYAYLERAPCLWQRYCTNKLFEISNLFVRRDNRGKGIANMLMDASRKLGADCGYPVVKTDATNYYTSKICEKLKMKLAFEIPYCAYTGRSPTREPVFKPPPPHSSCKVYIDLPFSIKR